MLETRVQRPQVHQRTDRKGTYWFFRYWHEVLLPDGSIKTIRRFHTLGPRTGQNALTQLEAEAQRDRVLAGLNTSPPPLEAVVPPQQPKEVGTLLFGNLAEMWRKDHVDNPKIRLAEPTRIKYRTRLRHHILPRWRTFPSPRCDPSRS